MTIRILLADGHRSMRDGLRTILSSEESSEIVGEAENGSEAIGLARTLALDVVVIDMDLPDLGGVEATRRIKAENPAVEIIALSTYADRGYVLGTLEAGASGYVLKTGVYDELPLAIRAVAQGKEYVSPDITEIVVDAQSGHPSNQGSSARVELDPQERRIVQLLSEGYTLPEIARRMHIATRSVAARRRAIMKKLDLESAAELTEYAVREGLASPGR